MTARVRTLDVTPAAIGRCIVVIPAHDEEALLPHCLAAVAEAARQVDVEVDVLVAADACHDTTAPLALAAGACVVELDAHNVGAARAAAVAAWHGASAGSAGPAPVPAPAVWVATTDADSVVPPEWLVAQLSAAAAGADAVVGMVRVASWEDRPSDVARLWQAQHLPAASHRHVHGANLGVRLSALQAVGGFRPLATGEDVDLVTRLEQSGKAVLRTATAPVVTSARRLARAPHGFASYLDRLEAELAV